jgi:AraC-like DNA-binding protein
LKINQQDKLQTAKISTKQEILKKLDIAKAYIDIHFTRKLDIEEIAREAAMSEFHFFRTFKLVFGISPYQYILQKRMKKATQLLNEMQHSVTEIAYLTGFSDIHAFSKAFKKSHSLSPISFIQQFH